MAKKGEKISEETKIKMSKAQIGFKNHQFGKKASLETKLKMSKSHKGINTWIKGRKLSEEHKLKIKIGNLGKRISEETRAKMKIAAVKRNPAQWISGDKSPFKRPEVILKISGENNHRWLKDRSLIKHPEDRNNPEYKRWRLNIYRRDNFKCRINNCDCSGRIIAHHILSFTYHSELRYDVNNGITLCLAHHPRKRSEEAKLSPFFQRLVAENK